MSELSTLFNESEQTSMGVFYPKKYIIATFPSFEAAKSANDALHRAGTPDGESRAVPGSDVLEFFSELREQTGIWGDIMTEFSRLLGTEAAFVDNDVKEARRGAGFLAVHCSNETEAERIRKLVMPFEPVAMQWYISGGIRSLV